MQTIKVGRHRVQLDIAAELSDYHFDNARWSADKLIASSPFRDDRAPSFYVTLEGEYAGVWGDSGSYVDEYSKGNFVKLIALLNGYSYEEACDYLVDKYGALYSVKEGEEIRLEQPRLRLNKRPVLTIDNPITPAVSPYLIRRGIAPDVQERYGVGYDEHYRGYTAIPLRTEGGDVSSVFYRRSSMTDKRFFYSEEGEQKSRLLFGIDQAGEQAIICEGIIDAMSWETMGYSALAVGGSSISMEQVEMIRRSGIKRLYLAGDNDEQGRRLNRQIAEALRGYVEMYEIDYGEEKDANAALLRQGIRFMHDTVSNARPLRAISVSVE